MGISSARQRAIEMLPSSLAETIGDRLPRLTQLQITAALFDPYTEGVRRISGAFPSGQIQTPEVPQFLMRLARTNHPKGSYTLADIESNFAFRKTLWLPSGLYHQDIVTQRAMDSLPLEVRRAQAARILGLMSNLHTVSYLPDDLILPEIADMNVTFVDSTRGTSATIDVLPATRARDGVVETLGNEYGL